MQLSFRWFGPDDPVSLRAIRQIPDVETIVSALYDVPAGHVWPEESLVQLRDQIHEEDLQFSVVESIPVHESVKLGKSDRDRYIDAFCTSLEHVAQIGGEVVCYNFMPVVDWTRTTTEARLPDGSTTLAYDHDALAETQLGELSRLPGWADNYSEKDLHSFVEAYRVLPPEALWDHLSHFLERVVPVAETCGVRLAIHPDDPPWPILGIPRIITSGTALARVTELVESPANGVTLCTGSLGADPAQDLPATIDQLGDAIQFVHARNVSVSQPRHFHETAHPNGDVDLAAVIDALKRSGYAGPIRPDHGRMIWGEHGRPGYGLHDRALGAAYLHGLLDAVD